MSVIFEKISMCNNKEAEDSRKFPQNFQFAFAIVCVLVGFIILFIYLDKVTNGYSIADKDTIPDLAENGQIGDFIGGVIGTFFSLAGTFLLFSTLSAQRETFRLERFEARFFEYIKMHRENVNELVIADEVKGRACFKYMINELRFICMITEYYAMEEQLHRWVIDEEYSIKSSSEYIRLAYLIMFFGIGYSSERQLLELLSKDEKDLFYKKIKPYLENVQAIYRKKAQGYSPIYFTFDPNIPNFPEGFGLETKFYPFDGHTTRLGHYFRNIFQAVKYVDGFPNKEIPLDKKYEYLKSLRATFSNHEQLIIYYNSLSVLGEEWHITGLLKRYALVKNMPLGIVDIGIHPHDKMGVKNKEGHFLFETDEIRERNKLP